MLAKDKLNNLIQPTVEGMGYEFVGCEYHKGYQSVLTIYIDHPNGISVRDCQKVSRQVGAVLDVADPIIGQYQLEVSSPGIDRPLFHRGQYPRFIGKHVSIRLSISHEGRKNFSGKLLTVTDEKIEMMVDDKTQIFLFDDIEKAHIISDK